MLQLDDRTIRVLNQSINRVTQYYLLERLADAQLLEAVDNLRLVWAQIYQPKKGDNDSYKDTH